MSSCTDRAYAAGIIDGEGCIFVFRSSSKTATRRMAHSLVVNVTMTEFETLEWLKSVFGGAVYGNGIPRKKEWNAARRWELRNTKAQKFLRLIINFLKVKRRQAEVAIAMECFDVKTGRPHSISDETFARREECYFQLRELKIRNKGKVLREAQVSRE
mgnify:CR=1 FL=1